MINLKTKTAKPWRSYVDINSDINDVLAFNFAKENALTEVCNPLFNCTKASYFHHTIFYNDGRRQYFCTKPGWLNEYFKHNFHNNNNHAKIYNLPVGRHSALWGGHQKDRVFSAIHALGIWNGFSIYDRKEDSIESFHFASDLENISMNSFYINNLWLFERFISYYKNRFNQIVNTIEDFPSVKSDLKIYPRSLAPKVDHFLNCATFKKFYLNDEVCLTEKQYEIVKHIAHGKTSKEAADALAISYQTVETHLKLIKRRTNLSRSSLIELFHDNALSFQTLSGKQGS